MLIGEMRSIQECLKYIKSLNKEKKHLNFTQTLKLTITTCNSDRCLVLFSATFFFLQIMLRIQFEAGIFSVPWLKLRRKCFVNSFRR